MQFKSLDLGPVGVQQMCTYKQPILNLLLLLPGPDLSDQYSIIGEQNANLNGCARSEAGWPLLRIGIMHSSGRDTLALSLSLFAFGIYRIEIQHHDQVGPQGGSRTPFSACFSTHQSTQCFLLSPILLFTFSSSCHTSSVHHPAS